MAFGTRRAGLLSTKTTTIRTDTESDTAITSKVTGKNVNIAAKRDATFTAANIAADSDVNIAAGRNFSAVSAENYSHTENYKEVKKSGIFGSGSGLGFTIGTQQTKTTQDSDAITQQGTNIAALGGNVSISAGENAHISSSAILADKDATVNCEGCPCGWQGQRLPREHHTGKQDDRAYRQFQSRTP